MIVTKSTKTADELSGVYNKAVVQHKIQRNAKLLELYNSIAQNVGGARLVNVAQYLKSADLAEVAKGLDGTTTTARGTRLLQTNYQNTIQTLVPLGGVFEEAGANVMRNEPGTEVQFMGYYRGKGSGYLPLANNASATWAGLTGVTNDQTRTIINERASLVGHIVETFVRKSVLQGFLGDANAIINLFEEDFMLRDALHDDELGFDAIVLNAAIAGSPLSGAEQGNLVQTFLNIRAELGAVGVSKADLHLSSNGANQLLSERDAEGNFLTFTLGAGKVVQFQYARNSDGSNKEVGFIGSLDGSKVYINNGISDECQTTGNNITATSGGDKTAMVIGDTRLLGIGSGKEDLNTTDVVSQTEEAIRRGVVSVFRTRHAGAVPIIPQSFGYAAF